MRTPYLLLGVLVCNNEEVERSAQGVLQDGVYHLGQHSQQFWFLVRFLLSKPGGLIFINFKYLNSDEI